MHRITRRLGDASARRPERVGALWLVVGGDAAFVNSAPVELPQPRQAEQLARTTEQV